MRDIKAILKAWANVRVYRKTGLEYPSAAAGFLNAKNFDFREYLTEEEASKVDEAILSLKKENYPQYLIIKDIYEKGSNCNEIAIKTHSNKDKIYRMLNDAERFIFGYIYQFFSKAA